MRVPVERLVMVQTSCLHKRTTTDARVAWPFAIQPAKGWAAKCYKSGEAKCSKARFVRLASPLL